MTSGVKWTRLSMLAALALSLSLFAVPALAQTGYKIVKIDAPTRELVQKAADLGIDIWEVKEGKVTAYVSPEGRQALTDAGLSFEVIVDDVGAYLKELEQPRSMADPAYHTYATLTTDLYALEASGVAKVYNIGSSIEGRDMLAVRISDNPDQDEEGEPAVLLVGCHHAREWMSLEVPYYIALYLVDNYGTDPDVTSWVDNGAIWVVPLVNPDGHEYTQNPINRLWRKNRRDNGSSYGVDLNRNYDINFGGAGSSAIPSSDTYHGTEAFSEPETQAIRDLFNAYYFKALITYHTYGPLVLYPWGYTYSEAPDNDRLSFFANEMEGMINAVHGSNYVAEKSSDLYRASGTTDDWTYSVTGIPSFTIEMNTSFTASNAQIIPTYEENLPAALYLIGLSLNDDDGDGVTDIDDNCIGTANPGQEDNDLDLFGPPCDCNDSNANVNPGEDEICSNGIDDNCDGLTDDEDPGCSGGGYSAAANAEASLHGPATLKGSGVFNEIALIFMPLAAIIFIRIRRRRK